MFGKRGFVLAVLIGWAGAVPAAGADPVVIVCPADASGPEMLAAREIRRYLYVRTRQLAAIVQARAADGEAQRIIVGRKDREPVTQFATQAGLLPTVTALRDEHYLLKTTDQGGRRALLIAGGDAVGTLYGAYRFAEHLGVRFYLHGDAIPDDPIAPELPVLDERAAPLFALRGIQPFHDFPEGPDWWSLDDYLAIISQLPKLRMNFIGLHTYPEGGVGPEPTVWIGRPEEVTEDGHVHYSYPARHFCTLSGTWGYHPKRTGEYSFGAAQLYEHDAYCQDVQVGQCPWPDTPEQCNDLFNRFGSKLRSAFEHAHRWGVKTCVGTEVPLVVPRAVALRFAPKPRTFQAIGGALAAYGNPIADTEDDALYQTVRWDVSGYRLTVPNGRYRVTLKFCEVHYNEPGKRVFGVRLQGQPVIEGLDIFAKVGKDRAVDYSFAEVEVTDGTLAIDFVKQVEFPCIAGIAVEGPGTGLKIDCGGPSYKDYLADEAGPSLDAADIESLYAAMFLRIMRAYPIDYYWFWTPEGWTWQNVSEAVVQQTLADIERARAAARRVNAPFQLATCGWVLGPQYDRALFDKALPKDVPVSCINRAVGHDPVDPGFAQVSGRPKWAIPWLEDDPAMISPQLWVGRMRRDAADALDYGCTGLMGIHWRTRILGPNVSALAQAAWNQGPWRGDQTAGTRPRHLAADDFYADWALHQFGPAAAPKIAAIFARIDGKLPRPSDWVDGPGGLKPDPRPWAQVSQEYAFVEELAALRPLVQGAGNLERFDYWVNTFRYMRANARVNCLRAQYAAAMEKVRAESDPQVKRQRARETALPLRAQLVEAVGEVFRYLLATVTNVSELGTIANWEQHNLPPLLTQPGQELSTILGEALPPEASPSAEYGGEPRLIVPTTRTSLLASEDLVLKVIVLARARPREASLYWRTMGEGGFKSVPLVHVARAVYSAAIPAAEIRGADVEYHVKVVAEDGKELYFPAAAPQLNHTVVVTP